MIHIEASKAIFSLADKQSNDLKSLLIQDGINHLLKSLKSTDVSETTREEATEAIVTHLHFCSSEFRQKIKNILLQDSIPKAPEGEPLPGPAPAPKGDTEQKGIKPEDCIVKKWRKYHWNSLILPDELKTEIRNLTVMPLKYHGNKLPGVTPGILLYGSPGVGKTSLMNCIQTECPDVTVFKISVSEVCQRIFGDSEAFVSSLFQLAEEMAPSLIFIDEIDGLARKRTSDTSEASLRIKTAILGKMDTNMKGVIVVGCTNFPNVSKYHKNDLQYWYLEINLDCRYLMRLFEDVFKPNFEFHFLESMADF